jgi:hypothetical protein
MVAAECTGLPLGPRSAAIKAFQPLPTVLLVFLLVFYFKISLRISIVSMATLAADGGEEKGAAVSGKITLTVRARPGRLSGLSIPQRFPMKIHCVWGFCMGAQGA